MSVRQADGQADWQQGRQAGGQANWHGSRQAGMDIGRHESRQMYTIMHTAHTPSCTMEGSQVNSHQHELLDTGVLHCQ